MEVVLVGNEDNAVVGDEDKVGMDRTAQDLRVVVVGNT